MGIIILLERLNIAQNIIFLVANKMDGMMKFKRFSDFESLKAAKNSVRKNKLANSSAFDELKMLVDILKSSFSPKSKKG